jgi:hypothetical protein
MIEKEMQNSVNFLDLTIYRKERKLKFAIYGKHTQTDIIIPSCSCHPHEHQISSINYLLRRLHVYQITKEAKETELNVIKTHCITTNII